MRLADLIRGLPVEPACGGRRDAGDVEIGAVVEDSRRVTPGALFVARPGTRVDGRAYIGDAIERGAVAVLTDRATRFDGAAIHLATDDVAAAVAFLAERIHGEPSRRLTLVGVTGTNGKTTVASLIHQILNHASVRCGLLGTVAIDDGAEDTASGAGGSPGSGLGSGPGAAGAPSLTTPAATDSSRHLATMVAAGCRAAVMEASSHGLAQSRTAALAFDGAIFTNLSGDHLDYHGDRASYAAAKGRLFAAIPASGWAIVNDDDPAGGRMASACRGRVVRASLLRSDADARAEIGRTTAASSATGLVGGWGRLDVTLPLVGAHNVMNALQATAACHEIGLDHAALAAGLAAVRAPAGRLEPVTAPDDPFAVIVDYAHTDDALDNVLRTLRPLARGGRLIVVFGCGGDRDRTKRPRMAAVACAHADEIIVTSDNPRTETPAAIIDEIMAGVPAGGRGRTRAIEDRRAAIQAAVARAGGGDVVLIAGKGHEDYQIVGTDVLPFDDRAVAGAALRERLALAAPGAALR